MQDRTADVERWLRIDKVADPALVMRLRAVWAIGFMFVSTQVLNMIVMSASYGRWTYDHTLTVVAIAAVFGLIALLRVYQQTAFYAFAYSALLFLGVMGSALPEHTGVNTAILPFIALGPVMCGLMAGRRAAILNFGAAGVVVMFLYWVSVTHAPTTIYGDHVRETNRMAQGFFALSLSTMISVFVCDGIYSRIAESRESAERARRAEAAKSEFLATMSHELRTPLNGVIGLAEALKRRDLAEPDRRLAETIANSGDSLLRILNDILDLSKIEAGKMRIELRAASPRDLVRHVADSWRETAHAKGLSLEERVDGDPLPEAVVIDDLRTTQILQNFVSNAVKFTKAGRIVISLTARRLDEAFFRLEFRVIDNGKGVPETMRERIFERFDQGETGTARDFGGTGLGLPICRNLATLMGGAILVEKSSSQGSTFLFTLKVAAARAADGAPTPVDWEPANIGDLRVLVAEDDEVSRLVLAEFLRSFNLEAEFVEDGAACVAKARSRAFDLVLLDREMPVMNGEEAARAIRSAGASSDAVIIAITGAQGEGEREGLLAAGVDACLAKPVSRAALGAAIAAGRRSRTAA